MTKKEFDWSPLDNAAKIFPAVRSAEFTAVMRLTAVLKQPVVVSHLFRAVEFAEKRFPYFKVHLRKGFFWYFLEQIDNPIVIKADEGMPCQAFDSHEENGLLIRVLAYRNTITVECSHIITDGYGLLIFLKSLLIFYFRERGLLQTNEIDEFYTSKQCKEEFEDAYGRYFKENIPPAIRISKAFHLPYQLSQKPRFDTLFAILPIGSLKLKAKEKGVTITDYLVAVYLHVLQDIFTESKEQKLTIRDKIGRIQVPINLRHMYSTKTMRNFSLFVMPEIDFRLGKYTFDEILKKVYHQMKLETDEKNISKTISRNVGGERNRIVRGIPIWFKSLLLYAKYYSEGANQFSGVVTNLGKIDLPESIRNHVDYFAITPPPPNKKIKINCGVVGYEEKLVLSFGNITISRDFERRFLHFLVQQGINVRVTKIV